jgi:hypothetical protein
MLASLRRVVVRKPLDGVICVLKIFKMVVELIGVVSINIVLVVIVYIDGCGSLPLVALLVSSDLVNEDVFTLVFILRRVFVHFLHYVSVVVVG